MGGPASKSPRSLRLPVLCFFLGVLLFLGAQGLIFHWFHDPDYRRGSHNGDFMAAISFTPGENSDSSEVSALELARRHAAKQRQVKIFFTTDGRKLQPQVVSLTKSLSLHERLRFVLETLLDGPVTEAFQRTVPEGTRLRAAYVQDDRAVVDLEGDLLTRPLGGPMAELLCVYGIVNTIVENLEPVKEVQILVQGRKVPILWDQVDLRGPFMANAALSEY